MVLISQRKRRRLRPIFNTAGSQASYPSEASFATGFDTIPNFALSADILSVQSGNWTDTTTWNLGRVPAVGEVVGIKTTHTVTMNNDTTTKFKAVGVAGTLDFATGADTQLWTQHLMVYTGGHLKVGTAASPIGSGFTAEIVFTNVAIDIGTLDALGADPAQIGNGLIALGRVQMHGAVKTPFMRVSVEPAATATSFTFASAPSGWAVGDRLVIPDTRQVPTSAVHGSYSPQWEERAITSLTGAGTVANFTGGLTFDHLGWHNEAGTLDTAYLPHVANISRNVILRSELGTGTRGHVLFTNRANVDIRYVQSSQMGRTTNGDLSSYFSVSGGDIFSISNASPIVVNLNVNKDFVTGDQVKITGAAGNTAANGTWTITKIASNQFSLNTSTGNGTYSGGATILHLGTQQIGRYALHTHHLWGPVGALGYDATVDPAEFTTNGASWRIIGCAVEDPLPASPSFTMPASKWALAIHDSHYGLVKANVFHHFAGSGLVTEDGSESQNVIDGNFALNIFGNVDQRGTDMRSGSGFTFQGYNNRVRNNVSAGNHGTVSGIVNGSGYYYSTSPSEGTTTKIPNFQGANMLDSGEYTLTNRRNTPVLQFLDNEAYGGISTGLSVWWLGSDGYEMTAPSTSTFTGLKVWHAFEEAFFGYPMDDCIFDGLIVRGDNARLADLSNGFTFGDYWASDIKLINCNIQGVYTGINPGTSIHGTFYTIEDSAFNCFMHNILIQNPSSPGNGTTLENRVINIDNCTFDQWGADAGFFNIKMDYTLQYGKTNLRVKDVVNVIDYDGVLNDNFRLYYAEQTSATIMPISTGAGGTPADLVACPEAGLTNAQAYVAYNQDDTTKTGGALSDPTGCAIGGAISPAGATTRAGIDGLLDETV